MILLHVGDGAGEFDETMNGACRELVGIGEFREPDFCAGIERGECTDIVGGEIGVRDA